MTVLHHSDLMFLKISNGSLFGLLDGNNCGILGLVLLLIGFLFDLEILTNVKLSRDREVDFNSHDRVKVGHELVFDLEHLV